MAEQAEALREGDKGRGWVSYRGRDFAVVPRRVGSETAKKISDNWIWLGTRVSPKNTIPSQIIPNRLNSSCRHVKFWANSPPFFPKVPAAAPPPELEGVWLNTRRQHQRERVFSLYLWTAVRPSSRWRSLVFCCCRGWCWGSSSRSRSARPVSAICRPAGLLSSA